MSVSPIQNKPSIGVYGLFLILISITPLLAQLLGHQLHINALSVFLSLLVILSPGFSINLRYTYLLFSFFFSLQVLLIISWFIEANYGGGGLSGLLSALRPVFLFFMCIAFLGLLERSRGREYEVYDSIKKTFRILLLLIILSYILKNSPLSSLYFFLYEISDKEVVREAFVSFYGFTYYASFIYFIILIFFYSSYVLFRLKSDFICMGLCCFLIFLANSKPFIIAGVLLILLLPITLNRTTRFVSLLLIGAGVVVVYSHLAEIRESSYALRGIFLLIEGKGVGSADVRLSQVVNSFELSLSHYGLGVGLGREKGLMLESHLAEWFYRYGLIGFFVHIFFYLGLLFLSLKTYRVSADNKVKALSLFSFLWVFFLPLTLSSALMVELSKMAVFSMFIYSLVIFLYYGAVSVNNSSYTGERRKRSVLQ